MAVTVAEYLGKRTDVEDPITPIIEKAPCPFQSDNTCMKSYNNKNPVCSVRKDGDEFWIVCQNRLCSTKKDIPLCEHQRTILLDIAQSIFNPRITAEQILVRREVPLKVNASGKKPYHADYIMTINEGKSPYPGPDRVILEMQGGGETSGTEKMTAVVKAWKNSAQPTNALLRKSSGASPLETNAWRRQQEQFIVKGNIAMQTWKGCGMAFCVGTLLYKYLNDKIDFDSLPKLKESNWTLAIVPIEEDKSSDPVAGPVPLKVNREKIVFTNYQTFVHALINQGVPNPAAFKGKFVNLMNQEKTIKLD